MGGTHATMEVSSHALALGRVYGMHFHTAVFTNLTRDHLDFHHTMEDYFAAKQLLFSGAGAPAPRFAVINRDDEHGATHESRRGNTRCFWYGLGKDADGAGAAHLLELRGSAFRGAGAGRTAIQDPIRR